MDVKKQIKSFLQQAELYQSQGLLYEAKENYLRAGQLVKKNEELIKNKNLLGVIAKKINVLKEKIDRIENEPLSVELPEKIQDIIKEKFSFSKDTDAGALEGAIALAKFGQFERALKEFNSLIERESLRVEAAKNIIRCHKAIDSIDEAVSRYQQWFESDFFTPDQLGRLRVFFQGILDSKGIDIKLPQKAGKMMIPSVESLRGPAAESANAAGQPEPAMSADAEEEIEEEAEEEENIIDISSVGIALTQGPRKGEIIEYDVSFQAGRVINLLISGNDTELIETLNIGVMLDNVQFYSPIAMFNGKAVVSSKSKIESGPKQGFYSLDIKIISI